MVEDIVIRTAALSDMRSVFDLSNDAVVRAMSIHPEKIEWDNHIKWFHSKLADTGSPFYIMEIGGIFAGYAHLNHRDDQWIITIHLDHKFRGKGYGGILMDHLIDRNRGKQIVSYIKKDNTASKKLFLSRGFTHRESIVSNHMSLDKYSLEVQIQRNIIAISNDLYSGTTLFSKNDVIYVRKNADLTYENLKNINPKYVFFPHWSHIIPAEIYENFQCIIFHMTDLPFGRGGSPLQNLIARKIYQTKISAIKCSREIDSGDIYMQRNFDISEGSATDIYKKAGDIISEMIDEIILTSPIPVPQVGKVVEFKRRTPEESHIGSLLDIRSIYDYIRMLDAEGYPPAFLRNNDILFEFSHAEMRDDVITAVVKIKKSTI